MTQCSIADYGELSAWLVLSSIGVYPEPCTNKFLVGSPAFRSVTVRSRRTPTSTPVILTVSASNNAHNTPYVRSVSVNNASPLTKDNYFVDGACWTGVSTNPSVPCKLTFTMSPTPA